MRAGDLLGGRYRLNDRIASGGMGTVWHGHDTTLERAVAVKVLHPGLSHDDNFRLRFHSEARVVGALSAPGIVGIHDFGVDTVHEDGPVVYLVMELVAGEALSTVLRRRDQLSPAETMRIVAACGDALEVAHRAGITHRDIKPGNILIDQHGNVKIVDFGIARTADADGLTTTGVVMGTAPYIAPEQLRGAPTAPAGDIYSLGIVAYQCLAGRRPFESDTPAAVVTAALRDEPPALPRDVPEAVVQVVMRALRKDPRDRWSSAQEFANAARAPRLDPDATALSGRVGPVAPLPDLAGSPQSGREGSQITPTARQPRRLAMVLLAATVVAALAAVIVIARPWQPSDADANQDRTTVGSQDEGDNGDSAEPSDESNQPSRTDEPSPATPQQATMPTVEDLHINEAHEELGDLGLTNIGYSDDTQGCYVKSQYPNPGMEIKSDHYVELRLAPESADRPCD